MRTLLTLILSRPKPAQRRGRPTSPPQHVPAYEPTQQPITKRNAGTVMCGAAASGHPLRGEDVALIRPYLVAHEQAHGIYHQEAAA